MLRKVFVFSVCALGIWRSSAYACDLCAISIADRMKYGAGQGLSVNVAEQFSAFSRLQDDGKHVENTAHQSLTSSITQVIGRYDFSSRVGAQVSLPFIVRDFRRPEEGEIKSGSESGLGDISVLALTTPYEYSGEDVNFHWGLRAGVKLPTGDTGRLKEETEEGHVHSDSMMMHTLAHEGHMHEGEEMEGGAVSDMVESGIHGHDLSLGTGSVDYVVGTNADIEIGRNYWTANVQYMIRSEGDYDYRVQNDLMWDTGIGRYLSVEHDESISLKTNLSGEYKGMDIFRGNKSEDTGVNSMFLGPEVVYSAGSNFSAHAGFELPLFIDNTDLQLVADYRIRLGLTYIF